MKISLLAAGILVVAAGCSFADIQLGKTPGTTTPPARQPGNTPSQSAGAQDRVLQKLSIGNRGTSTQEKPDFDRFKRELLTRIAKTPEIRNLYFWLHGPASAGYELSDQGESGRGTVIPMKIPKQFQWKTTEKGVVPSYE